MGASYIRELTVYLHFLSFFHTKMVQVVKIFPWEDKDLFILHNWYQDCWWPGNAKSQGISSHGIDPALLDYFGWWYPGNARSQGISSIGTDLVILGYSEQDCLTVYCHFSPKTCQIYTITHMWQQYMRFILWVQNLSHVLPFRGPFY